MTHQPESTTPEPDPVMTSREREILTMLRENCLIKFGKVYKVQRLTWFATSKTVDDHTLNTMRLKGFVQQGYRTAGTGHIKVFEITKYALNRLKSQ